MTVSLCVVTYNEEQFLLDLLRDLETQTYPHILTEIVLIDEVSSDSTKQIMKNFAEKATSFYSVQVLDNPDSVQAAGWNVAIADAKSDVIIRIDTHTHIPAEFTAKNMVLQEKGEYVTGGVCLCLLAVTGAVCTIINKKATRWTFLMPALFLIMHISYGIGTLVGVIKIVPLRIQGGVILCNTLYTHPAKRLTLYGYLAKAWCPA